MAQNVTIAGASYSGVPAIDVPKSGGGTARFIDPAEINATLLATLDSDFVAENIKKDVDLFGLVGTHEGGGGGSTPVPALSKGVNFIDYDGTVVATWQTSEVAGKTSLPSNPSHSGLTAQGWNWSLANIKSYIADYPDAVVWVGQMYITSDGKTRVYIHLEEGRLSPYLGLAVNGSVDIDWGDGTAHGTLTGTSTTTVKNTQHTYASGGDYVIVLTVTGTASIIGSQSYGSQLLWKNSTTGDINRIYQNTIQKVEIGSNIVFGSYAFYSCHSLTFVTIPNNVTSIGFYAFSNCSSLASVTIPDSVTRIDSYTFQSCSSLVSVIIPNGMTSIGSYAFYNCYSLASVTIPDSVTSIDNYVFQSCSLAAITIPDSVTIIGNSAFQSCSSLASVAIPDSVTSIGSSAFHGCYSLTSVTIPNNVTVINFLAFYTCYGLGFIKLTSTTPTTVSNINAWEGIPTDCIIYVPVTSLAAYKTATNYPNPATYSYVGYGTGFAATVYPAYFLIGDTKSYEFNWGCEVSGNPVINVSIDGHGTYSEPIIGTDTFSFNVTASAEGDLAVTVTATFTDGTVQTETYDSTVYTEIPEATYTVEAISGAAYGFALDDGTGYYVSQNYHISNSYAICRVRFNSSVKHMYVDCISYGESSYDYGILSNVDASLTLSKTADTTGVFKSFKGAASANVQTVDYGTPGIGEHTIDIKYIKDSSGDSNNDTLQFKVRFE